jgi:hypothetical protein
MLGFLDCKTTYAGSFYKFTTLLDTSKLLGDYFGSKNVRSVLVDCTFGKDVGEMLLYKLNFYLKKYYGADG